MTVIDSTPYSVALCTFNGARYLDEQLRSIFDAKPTCSELIVVDDASTDDSIGIVRRTLAKHQVHSIVDANASNIGSLRSFERALRMTTQPIVFLSDQDDVWHADKPARMLKEFDRRPDLMLLHSDARIVDSDARSLGYTLLRAIEVSPTECAAIHGRRAFDTFVRRNVATGATIAMRRELLEFALPIPDGWVHDEWLATVASAIGDVDFIDRPLIDYRQHASNQIGARRLSFAEKIAKALAKPGLYYQIHLERAQALRERLVALGPLVAPDRIWKVDQKLRHLRARESLPANRFARLVPIGREVIAGNYRRYSTGLKSVIRDLFHGV